MMDAGADGDRESSLGFICTGCRAQSHAAGTCELCGSMVVPLSADAPRAPHTDPTSPNLGPRLHGATLLIGLTALLASLAVGLATLLISGTPAALIAAGSCAVATTAMLLPWRERHNVGGSRGAVDRPSQEEMTSAAGVTLNPTVGIFTTMTGPSPYLVFVFVILIPLVTALAPGTAQVARLVTLGLAWVGFGLLYVRHTRRESEADGFTSRGVPL